MKQTESAVINIQLDTEKVEISAREVQEALSGLQKIAENICTQISDTFGVALDAIEIFRSSIDKLAESIQSAVGENLSGALTELSEISTALDSILAELQKPDWMEAASLSIQTIDFIGDNAPRRKTKNKGKYESGKTTIFSKGEGKYSAKTSNASGIAAGGIGTALGLDAMDGSLGDLLGDAAGGGSLTAMFSDLSTVVADAGQKMWEFGSAIGTAFSNFGSTIAQLATSTGTWIANTAAKVANTAAQWAQVAATTAWQAICAAATAVTTAFGAAMNFLASPIGLVVIAIVALIAIIVLLIANWDTVKAAVLTAWEAITGALATAADWFNTNVIQPIVGFFTTAFDWISTKLQEGLAFVQNIFTRISGFMQGVFAKDWTEQFGAFGNVLNAFFANVENVWNSVKDIFNGIVSFVKNVFAGDWGAAWDSIVSVFKGIWDYLVAVVKAPINMIIGLINGLVQGVVDGINLVIGALNGISFDIPDWVPVIGGQTFGFNLTPLVAPKIPLLAQGAVLPANKPFLAMVGDQRHGTNVEAPLATIQEAVAQVMENQFSGMMAGFEASVAVQKQILQAVLGIEVGDAVIGQAANRYNRRMAIIKGGM